MHLTDEEKTGGRGKLKKKKTVICFDRRGRRRMKLIITCVSVFIRLFISYNIRD